MQDDYHVVAAVDRMWERCFEVGLINDNRSVKNNNLIIEKSESLRM